jgi:hypothetical protein
VEHGDTGRFAALVGGLQQIGFGFQAGLDFVADELADNAHRAIFFDDSQLGSGLSLGGQRAQEVGPPLANSRAVRFPTFGGGDPFAGGIDEQFAQRGRVGRNLGGRLLNFGEPGDVLAGLGRR